jgi:hypothetical protein
VDRWYFDRSNDTTLWGLAGDKIAQYAREIEVLAKANTVLTQFHEKRRAAIEAGDTPTVEESLAALS